MILASWLIAQAWSWDATPTADLYRVYHSESPSVWCDNNFVEVDAESTCEGVRCEIVLPEPTGDLIYITVSAVNEAGESEWDHGEKVACP